MTRIIEIDGSQGEGGGQVLRSALTLSLLTCQPMHITNIRLHRPKPGLMTQHLISVKAAATISDADVTGATIGSQELIFQPGEIRPGQYRFDISTAGSTSLVLQTVLLPLALAGGKSHLTLTGGTHVPFSPCFHYLESHWLAYLQRMGIQVDLDLEQAGFYPPGGGKIHASIHSAGPLLSLQAIERGQLVRIQGLSGVANLDLDIARRQKLQALRRLEPLCRNVKIRTFELPSPVKGTFILLMAQFEGSQCCYCALGAPGKHAEQVADEAVDALQVFLATDGAIDQYLADQLLLPLAFADGESILRTSQVTLHLITNATILRHFLPVSIEIQGEIGQPGLVKVGGKN
jgi:RNA 3'-terminal phosphate cyclase (ATP)